MSRPAKHDEDLANIFEERAEDLDPSELERWTDLPSEAESVLAKLTGSGAKLLIGPRGCGKTTLLKTAYNRMRAGSTTLPVYVNYARSLALEPLFHRQANALSVFRQWLLMKIAVGLGETFILLGKALDADTEQLVRVSKSTVRRLERRDYTTETPIILSPSELAERLEALAEGCGRRRTVLLMDDAAHAFSPLQQREFFEVFRELKSRRLASKAAVYPGVTSYSPNLHVGHDAELVEFWSQPADENYPAQMRRIFERRIPERLRKQVSDDIVEYFALACFGIPRAFLNMLADVISTGVESARVTKSKATLAVAEHVETVRGVFLSLTSKLPRYVNLVIEGGHLDARIVKHLSTFNASHSENIMKTNVIALEEPLGFEGDRMVGLLEYAGILRRTTSVSRGVKGKFQRFQVHNAIMLAEGAFALGKSPSLEAACAVMRNTASHAFARAQIATLLGANFKDKCRLNLPPCRACKTPRVSEQQLYCVHCGAELTDASLYEELLNRPIDDLHLPAGKVAGIKEKTSIRTVQDLLLDDERQTIRQVPYIGPIWAKRIMTAAEEFVSV